MWEPKLTNRMQEYELVNQMLIGTVKLLDTIMYK